MILRYNYEDLFIMKMGFGYVYNNGVVALKTNVETAGNLLGACSKIFGGDRDDLGQYKLFNIAYVQYVKGDFDYTQQIFNGSEPEQGFGNTAPNWPPFIAVF